MPKSVDISDFRSSKFDSSGVYVLSNQDNVLYVGETCDFAARVNRILDVQENWGDFVPRSARFIPGVPRKLQCGVQSGFIHRTNPLLNSAALRPLEKVA